MVKERKYFRLSLISNISTYGSMKIQDFGVALLYMICKFLSLKTQPEKRSGGNTDMRSINNGYHPFCTRVFIYVERPPSHPPTTDGAAITLTTALASDN